MRTARRDDVPPDRSPFFDGYDAADAAEAERRSGALTDRFARPAGTGTHEVLITHAYQVAWLVRYALDAPPVRWLGLNSGNTALTGPGIRPGAARSARAVRGLPQSAGGRPPGMPRNGGGSGRRRAPPRCPGTVRCDNRMPNVTGVGHSRG